MGRSRHLLPYGVNSLLGRLQAYAVDWKFSFVPTEDQTYEPGIDRETADLDDANVVSSELTGFPRNRHAVILDIDYAAYVVPSSTPGHNHLYLDVPGGVAHDDYMELLAALSKCGVVEPGYAEVSIKRGHSDLRLPWVSKDEQRLHKSGEDGVDLKGIERPEPLPLPLPQHPGKLPF